MNSPAPAENAPTFMVRAQYIRDLSFENPNAPQSFQALTNKPTIDVSVDLKAQKLQEELYETTLFIAVRATADNQPLFLVELAYAGIFSLTNIPADRVEQVLMVDCPFVLFPFARRVVSDATRDGGFPPLMLDPIDFQALFIQNQQAPDAR